MESQDIINKGTRILRDYYKEKEGKDNKLGIFYLKK